MSQGPRYQNQIDGLLSQAVDKMSCGGMKNETGDWGHLPLEPCRFCHKMGGVYFRVDDSPRGKVEEQVVHCRNCSRIWTATSLA